MDYFFDLKDGRRMGVAVYGDPDGYPVFYFHGFPSSRREGWVLGEKAKELGICILSLDRPGFGLSSPQKRRTLLDWPNDVLEVADFMNYEKFSVLGASGGAPYALACGFSLSHRVQKVGVCVGLGPIADNRELLRDMVASRRFYYLSYILFPFSRLIGMSMTRYIWQHKAGMIASYGYNSKKDKEKMKEMAKEANLILDQEVFKQGLVGVMSDLNILVSSWKFDISQIHCPVYLWYGVEDLNTPIAMGEYFKNHLSNAHANFFPGEGHVVIKAHAGEILKVFVDK